MRRVIESAIENRKKKQLEIEKILDDIGKSIVKFSFFKSRRRRLQKLFSKFSESLFDLITAQDKEWDELSNNHYSSVFNSLRSQIEDLEAKFSNFKTVTGNFIDMESRLGELLKKIPDKISIEEEKELKKIREEISPVQYSDFEKRFRGDSEKIYKRQKKYIQYFKDKQNILDIGCGRGEFIQLLSENSIEAQGIDISSSMLKEAGGKGLKCSEEDALQFLKGKETNSLGGIFSAQVIEHFPSNYLIEIVAESHRVLKKGGVIIFETLNPLSLFALTNIYFLDITHQKPLHPEFMRYLFKAYGFSDVDILYSEPLLDHYMEEIPAENGIARQFNSNVDKLNRILFSSPDYAVIGKKQ